MDIPSTVVATIAATLAATVISSFVAWRLAENAIRSKEMSALHDMVGKMLDISIEHPFVEDDSFCSKWPPARPSSERAMRYYDYCCFVFNTLERVWRHFDGDREQVCKFIHAREIFMQHRKWWTTEEENRAGYDHGFQVFVDSFLEEQG